MYSLSNLKGSAYLSDPNLIKWHTLAQKIIPDYKSYLKGTSLGRLEDGPASRES
jgi:hypothetical protein